MCLRPITIKNPNYDSRFVKIRYKLEHKVCLTVSEKILYNDNYRNLHNRCITHIQVPCGCCEECRIVRSNEFVQRCLMESINSHVFFFTLTYDNKHLPLFQFESSDCELGEIKKYVIPYANFGDISDMFKRIRTDEFRSGSNIQFRYVVVSERGEKKHRPHFHGLLFVSNEYDPYFVEKHFSELFEKYWSINVGTRKNPIYESRFTKVVKYINGRPSTNFDFHYVRPDSITGLKNPFYYVSKYITKTDPYIDSLKFKLKSIFEKDEILTKIVDNSSQNNFDVMWRLVHPKLVCSRCFGLGAMHNYIDINQYLKKCVELSYSRNYITPKFYDPVNGKESNLCHYYKYVNGRVIDYFNKLYHRDNAELVTPFYDSTDAILFYLNDSDNDYVDSLFISDETYKEYENRVNRYVKRIDNISNPYHHLDDIDINFNVQQLNLF